ncbi:NACHT domain-containing protein [Streptomyces xinghaiensis]|uniref:NACHT domain-containing protein n=1 Tax=Streptomyces xinghaiensis TaxID=1038928 RepID=UPI00343C33B5
MQQWDHEARIRRLNDPYPLPVAWRPVEADLVEPWPLLAERARAWPGGPPGDPSEWPADAAGLAGVDAQIGEVFAHRVPTRRLVVLGEPGSGKTMLLIRLLQDWIERRPAGGLIPVLFSIASWDVAHQPLEGWLAEQLRRSHPGLRAPAPMSAARPPSKEFDLAQALLDAGCILPLLDGFDELPSVLQPLALDVLNRSLPAKQPLVLASRAAEYRTTLTQSGNTVHLNGAAGIHLLPLTPGQAATYLRRDAGGPAADRWASVIAHLGTGTAVGQALSTPLGLFLARTIYNPRPHSRAGFGHPIPHPDELCDTTAFPTRTALDIHLFNAFIPAVYTPHGPTPPRWPAHQAYHALVFLARHLETNRDGNPDLAWWELHHAIPARTRRLTTRLVFCLGSGLAFGLAFGPMLGLLSGLAVGGAAVLTFGLAVVLVEGLGRNERPYTPSARLHWSSASIASGLPVGLILGLAAGLTAGPLLGLAVGLTANLAAGLVAEKPDLATAIGPARLLSRDRRTVLTAMLAAGLAFGLAAGLAAGFTVRVTFGLAAGLAAGFTGGLVIGLTNESTKGAWGAFVVAKTYMAIRRQVPWNLMAFLKDAHEHRDVLRQVGAVYQFRHIDLQRHLARQP